MLHRTKDGNTKYAFHAQPLDNEILVSCKVTGMINTIKTCKLPILLEWEHPIARHENALKVIGAFSKAKDWKAAESQLLAGCILSLLSAKGKTTNFPNSSASEANMMLQSAGRNLLQELAEIILVRWNSDTTWIRVPKLSFDLAAYQRPQQSMSDVVSRYARIIRKALSLDELPAAETAEVYKAFKENSLKAQNKAKSKEWSESAANQRISDLRTATLERQIVTAKVLIKNLAEQLPKEILLKLNHTIQHIQFISPTNKTRIELAMSLRLLFNNKPQQAIADNLAFILENAQADVLEEDMLGISEAINPIVKSEKPKTLREIMAEKGVKI